MRQTSDPEVDLVPAKDEPPPGRSREGDYRFAVELARNGYPPEAIVRKLVEGGTDREAAYRVVERLADRLQHEEEGSPRPGGGTSDGHSDMLYGGLWCAGGCVVTAVSYLAAASAGGGTYVVAWGAIVFGGIQFFRGLSRASQR